MTDTKAYSLQLHNRILSSFTEPTRLLHDYTEVDAHEIDALVSSGDAFITLATDLDDVTTLLQNTPEAHPQLEKTIRTLLYLQRHYQIARKQPEHRQ